MTWDLLPDDVDKPQLYRLWIRRVWLVSTVLAMSYDSLWELTEVEFLELEKLAREQLNKQKEQQDNALKGGKV